MWAWLLRKLMRRLGYLPEFGIYRSGWLRGFKRWLLWNVTEFKTIVNLASVPSFERDRKEEVWAAWRGIKILHYSWGSGGPPEDHGEPRQLAFQLANADMYEIEKPIWVHCVAGKDRTGALIAMIQRTADISWGEVRKTWKTFGLPHKGWTDYVLEYFA